MLTGIFKLLSLFLKSIILLIIEIMFIWQLLRSGGCFYFFIKMKEKERKKQHTVSDCLFSMLQLWHWSGQTEQLPIMPDCKNWNVFQVPLSKLRSSWKKIWTNNRISSGRNHKVRNKISTNIKLPPLFGAEENVDHLTSYLA